MIQKIADNKISLKFEDQSVKTLPLDQLKHIDYGYCVTVHSAQGKTYENTIAAISNNKTLNSQKMSLVALSRHKSEFTAIVEDQVKLQKDITINQGKETSAMELTQSLKIKGEVV